MSRRGRGPEPETGLPVGATWSGAVQRGRGHVVGRGAHGPTGPSRQPCPSASHRCGQKPSEGVEQDGDVIRLGF